MLVHEKELIEFVINVSRQGNNAKIKLNLKINLQRLQSWVLNTSRIIVSEYVSEIHHYIFHFESIRFRSSRSQMSLKEMLLTFLQYSQEKTCAGVSW